MKKEDLVVPDKSINYGYATRNPVLYDDTGKSHLAETHKAISYSLNRNNLR